MFDAAKFIKEEFTDPIGLQRQLLSVGKEPPTVDAIRKWQSRNSIQSDWLILLIAVRIRAGGFDLFNYISEDDLCTYAKPKPVPTGAQPSIFD